MCANRIISATCLLGLMAWAPPIVAQTTPSAQPRDRFTVNLTEEAEPDSRAWEDPARIAFTINPDGADEFSAHVNLEAGWDLGGSAPDAVLARTRSINGYVRWNRETGDDRQNNLEAGLVFKSDYDVVHLLSPPEGVDLTRLTPEQRADLADRQGRQMDTSWRISAGYARTAAYPDLQSATCVGNPALPQCQTQFKESFRASAVGALFINALENQVVSRSDPNRVIFAYSIEPKFGVVYDHLFNSPVNVNTGIASEGGYLSALAGIAATITPDFRNPGWEIKASAQVRQRIHASATRRPSIEGTAEHFEVSATYYVLRPAASAENGWRAGISITYSHGGDPLTGAPDVDRIILALRLGRF